MLSRDSIANTFVIALSVCAVCSVAVSFAAVGLRGMQKENELREQQKNILLAGGILEQRSAPADKIVELFEKVETKLVDLDTGEYVEPSAVDAASAAAYDQRKAAKDAKLGVDIPDAEDLSRIGRREKVSKVYLVRDDAGKITQIILPVYGKGLWSTMYGFVALEADTKTVQGITFYEDGETPGLGGEINNPMWQGKWIGKEVYDDAYNVDFAVLKGSVNPDSSDAVHQVDGLSGATITSKGVQDLIRYWLGDDGFGPFLERIRTEGGGDGETNA